MEYACAIACVRMGDSTPARAMISSLHTTRSASGVDARRPRVEQQGLRNCDGDARDGDADRVGNAYGESDCFVDCYRDRDVHGRVAILVCANAYPQLVVETFSRQCHLGSERARINIAVAHLFQHRWRHCAHALF